MRRHSPSSNHSSDLLINIYIRIFILLMRWGLVFWNALKYACPIWGLSGELNVKFYKSMYEGVISSGWRGDNSDNTLNYMSTP